MLLVRVLLLVGLFSDRCSLGRVGRCRRWILLRGRSGILFLVLGRLLLRLLLRPLLLLLRFLLLLLLLGLL